MTPAIISTLKTFNNNKKKEHKVIGSSGSRGQVTSTQWPKARWVWLGTAESKEAIKVANSHRHAIGYLIVVFLE